MHYLTVSGGISYDIPHRPWYHSRFSLGLSLLRWVLVAHHPQVLMETDHGFLLGLYGEAVQEIRFYEKWAAEFFIRPQYPEPNVANLLIEIGLRLAYTL